MFTSERQGLAAFIVACTCAANAAAASKSRELELPAIAGSSELRPITVNDYVSLRMIDGMSVSPDGSRFAILVRQGDPAANDYRTGWFVGAMREDSLTFVGDAGDARPTVQRSGHIVGEFHGSESRWSPDGRWVAYALRRDGAVQLWRSQVDGARQEQLTRNAADVREFEWSVDGRALYFTAGTSREEFRKRDEQKARQGYRYDEDLYVFTDAFNSRLQHPLETKLSLWRVDLETGVERLASEGERAVFHELQARSSAGMETIPGLLYDAPAPPVHRADGALAWLQRDKKAPLVTQVMSSPSADRAEAAVPCRAEACTGMIQRIWWSDDGRSIVFWRREGLSLMAHGFYAWTPATGEVTAILHGPDADFKLCNKATGDRLVCVRETPTQPNHVSVIDMRSGAVAVVADVNAELGRIRFGKVERAEWDTPKFSWNEPGGELGGIYAKRSYGYVIYPPDFDPTKKYPLFIDPYMNLGGRFDRRENEHPIHAYAAAGFIVLYCAFPAFDDLTRVGTPSALEYSARLDFPRLTMFMESTVRALDMLASRGFVDGHRVGIGGVSHGTFVPLFMLQKQDRIAAISVSSPSWGPLQYYWGTARNARYSIESRGALGSEGSIWPPSPEGGGHDYYKLFDIADNVDKIEAPILLNLADTEAFAMIRLIRLMRDAKKPYDAYVFPDEYHVKWQPAHLQAVYDRNLDWFRFWLQDYEDPEPAKIEQYVGWRKLRDLQCKNPRSLRDYCTSSR